MSTETTRAHPESGCEKPAVEPAATAAQLLVRCLENEGVEWVFGIPGEETLDVNQALERSTQITFVPTRHEQGAAFMADAYGRLTGKPGVCLATRAREPPTSSPASATPTWITLRWWLSAARPACR